MFGLGNKTYEHYNAMALFVDERMEKLQATRVFEVGLGDDDAKLVHVMFINCMNSLCFFCIFTFLRC